MRINIKKTLEVFDEQDPLHKGLTTSLISLIGEDLATGCFLKFKKGKVKVLSAQFKAVGFRNGSGPRLDRWFVDDRNKILYQCEIKNWCSWATTGIAVSSKGVDESAKIYWESLLKSEFRGQAEYGKASKVLVEMEKPRGYEHYALEPLLILWWPISAPSRRKTPMFEVQTKELGMGKKFKTGFKKLNIFSVSLFLREQGGNEMDIEMTDTESRLGLLGEMIDLKSFIKKK